MNENETLFKNAPVHKAVFQMAIPTVISSLVLIIYNMADKYIASQIQIKDIMKTMDNRIKIDPKRLEEYM